jgi:hypothetical protein
MGKGGRQTERRTKRYRCLRNRQRKGPSRGILGYMFSMSGRVLAGLERARRAGKRPGRPRVRVPLERLQRVQGLPSAIGRAP